MPFATLLLPLLGRFGLYIAVAAGVIVAALLWDHSRVQKGVEKERARVTTEGRKTDAKARAARDAAERDPGRVLREWQRD